MESEAIIKKYELVLILDAKRPDSEKESIFQETVDTVTKEGGKIINTQVWFEKQKFTYDIKKCKEGIYYLINFEAPTLSIQKMRSDLRLKENILRFSIMTVDTHSSAEPAKVAQVLKD